MIASFYGLLGRIEVRDSIRDKQHRDHSVSRIIS